jgi:hypothetical protein
MDPSESSTGERTGIDYRREWRDYRVRRVVTSGLLLGFIPYELTLASMRNPARWVQQILATLAISYMLAVGLSSMWVSFWQCPKCGRPFFLTKVWFWRPFARACVHCGLEKWAPGPLGIGDESA